MSSVVKGELTIPFEISSGFRKRVANTLNIGFKDLPLDDREFLTLVMNYMCMDVYLIDTISQEKVDITCYISDQVPQEFIPGEDIPEGAVPLEGLSEDNPFILPVVPEDETPE